MLSLLPGLPIRAAYRIVRDLYRDPLPTDRVGVNDRNVQFHHLDAGPGAPKLVFVHGYYGDSQMYRAFIRRLNRAGYSVLAIDIPGFARSDAPPAFTMTSIAGQIKGAVDQVLGRDARVHWLGHSLGGELVAVCAALDVRRPHSVHLLQSTGGEALCDQGIHQMLPLTGAVDPGPALGKLLKEELFDKELELENEVAVGEVKEAVRRRLFAIERAGLTAEAIYLGAFINTLHSPLDVARLGLLAYREHVRPELRVLAESGVPTIPYRGRHDRVVPEGSYQAQCQILRCEGVLTSGGHLEALSHPRRYADVVLDQLRGIDPPEPGRRGPAQSERQGRAIAS